MRKILSPQLPETNQIKDGEIKAYAEALNRELDVFRTDLNKYIGKFVITSVDEDTTLKGEHEVVLCDGEITITLPPASGSMGKLYIIKNIGSSTVTIDANGSETIDGATTKDLSQDELGRILSDGTEWWII